MAGIGQYCSIIGQLPRVSTEDRVVSVFEPCVCLFFVLCLIVCLSANFLIFPSFILLFLYSTVQKSAVQYSYWPTPSSIHRGLEWPQCLNRLLDCSLFFVCLLACQQIFSFLPLSSFSFYTVQYSKVQYNTV